MSIDGAPLVPSTSDPLPAVATPRVGTSPLTIALGVRSAVLRLVVEVPMILAVLPFVLSTLTPARYGVWATFASLLTLGGLLDAGIRVEVTRRVGGAVGSADPNALQRAVSSGVTQLLVLAAGVAVVGAAVGPLVLAATFPRGAPVHLGALYAGVLALLLLSVLSGALFGTLKGLQRPDIENLGAIAGLLVTAVVSVVLLRTGFDIWALYWAAVGAYLTRVGIQYVGLRRLAPGLRLRPGAMPRGSRRTTVLLSGSALLTQVPEVVNAQWDKLVLSNAVGPSAVTQYELGSALGLQARVLALLPLLPLLAAMSELRVRDPLEREALFERLSRTSAAIGAVVLLGVVAFAPSFFRVWLGSGYGDAGTVAQLVAVGMLVGLVGAPWVSYALAERWHRAPAASAVALMAVNATATVLLVPRVGLLGATIGTMVANVVAVGLLLVLLMRRRRRAWLRPAVLPVALVGAVAAAAAAAGSTTLTSRPGFLAAVAGFVLLTGALLVATGLLRPREVVALVRR
jgi:O-antigen/teichoic acid export membrane protein